MVTDFVPLINDGRNNVRMMLGNPSWDEERCLEIESSQDVEHKWHTDPRTVCALREKPNPVAVF